MNGQLVLPSRLAIRDLRRRPVEAVLVFLVVAAAATTLTIALALSGVTSKPYEQTRQATAGPDIVAMTCTNVRGLSVLGERDRRRPICTTGHCPGRDRPQRSLPGRRQRYPISRTYGRRHRRRARQTPAAVDQPKLTQGGWIAAGAIVIERGFADALGVHPGDTVSIGGRSLRVAGIAVTAAIPPYPSSLCHIACPFPLQEAGQVGQGVPNTGLVWLTRSAVADLTRSATRSPTCSTPKLANPAQASASRRSTR